MADRISMKVTNKREIRQAFRRLDKDTQKAIQKELRKVAGPVAEKVRQKLQAAGFPESTVSGVRPGTSVGIAKVRQSRRKSTGDHPEYGAAQMQQAFLPALHESAEFVREGVSHAIDQATGKFNRG